MAHHEILFPRELALGFKGGPRFLVPIAEGGGGQTSRNKRWAEYQGKWTGSLDMKALAYLEHVRAFFVVCGGPGDSFLLIDPHHNTATNQPMSGTVGGGNTIFQLQYRYQIGGASGPTATKTIYKPITSNVKDYLGVAQSAAVTATDGSGGSPLTVSAVSTSGLVTFSAPPTATPYASFQFAFPVFFGKDWLPADERYQDRGSFMDIELREEARTDWT
jgi:uncharacterized protein (TIGR02217 family)